MKKHLKFTLTSLFVIFILTSCNGKVPATPEPPAATPTPEISPTPTLAPDRIVLFDPSAQASTAITTTLSEFSTANGVGFETWTSLNPDLSGVKVMVVFGGLDNLADVAASSPQTQFLTVSTTISAAGNISTIGADPVHLAFMAGYLAAMTSDDWRAGALLADDVNLGLANAFTNGGQYLCGRCTPQFTPMLSYPQAYALASQSGAAAWTVQAQALWTDTNANSIYIDPAADFAEVLDVFSDRLLFGSNPGSANLSRYTAVLGADLVPTLQTALPELLAGAGGKTYTGRVGIVINNNPDVVSPAKQVLFDQVALDLANNQIIPLSIP